MLTHYRRQARDLPWRATTDPYRILVSEIMLQQTQVPRVREKYALFLTAFPTLAALARAPLARVLQSWQGLGYNRRALLLHRLAQQVTAADGVLPATPEKLMALPGIGPATAAAICAYAYNRPVVYIETNIRAVFIHEFFGGRSGISDAQLLPLVAQGLDRRNPRRWYNALMDYGTQLKARHGNPARRSAHHVRQTRFAGSDRQVRGGILRHLLADGPQPAARLAAALAEPPARVRRLLATLVREGMLTRCGSAYAVAETVAAPAARPAGATGAGRRSAGWCRVRAAFPPRPCSCRRPCRAWCVPAAPARCARRRARHVQSPRR